MNTSIDTKNEELHFFLIAYNLQRVRKCMNSIYFKPIYGFKAATVKIISDSGSTFHCFRTFSFCVTIYIFFYEILNATRVDDAQIATKYCYLCYTATHITRPKAGNMKYKCHRNTNDRPSNK